MKWKESLKHAGFSIVVLILLLYVLESPTAQKLPFVSFITKPFGVG